MIEQQLKGPKLYDQEVEEPIVAPTLEMPAVQVVATYEDQAVVSAPAPVTLTPEGYQVSPEDKELIDSGKAIFDKLTAEVKLSVFATDEELILYGAAIATNAMVLFDGVWGVGKTHTVKALAKATGGTFGRLQGSPGVRDKEITGFWTIDPRTHEPKFIKSALHENFSLIDEMHRIPEKQQAGLVEGMEEGQVSINNETMQLPKQRVLFGTRNPKDGEIKNVILDRLDFSNRFAKQTATETLQISKILRNGHETEEVLSTEDIDTFTKAAEAIHVSDDIEHFAHNLVDFTYGHPFIDQHESISGGYRHKSKIVELACAHALATGKYEVGRDDIEYAAPRVLQHRIVPTHEAEYKLEVSSQDIVNSAFKKYLQVA